MNLKYYILLIFLICKIGFSFGQVRDSDIKYKSNISDTIIVPIDSSLLLRTQADRDSFFRKMTEGSVKGAGPDSLPQSTPDYKTADDALEEEVRYEAVDSSWVDAENERIHLYGGAKVEYQKLQIKADSIVLDFKNNILEGYYLKPAKKVKAKEKATFTDGENNFTFENIRYNFKSKKGMVNQAITQQGEFNLVGSKTKYISGGTDTTGTSLDDRIYNEDAIITTCNHYPPHFGIRTNKLKMVPNKLAVLSVAQIEIASVPTPLFLPFGFFPLTKGKSSGLIFPSSYEYNAQLGLGLREIGYYWPINNFVDLRVTGDIYTRGSHGLRINTNYKKRYGFTGNILLGYSNNIQESDRDGSKQSNKSFNINISHRQDSKAHPYRNIGGSINIQTNRYDQRVYENPNAALTGTYSSNFSFSHDMPGTPFRFNAELRHSQNTQTRVMDITLPNMTLRMNTIFPFKRKNITKERWTDNIALSYSSEFRNFVKTTDTTLFTTQTLNNIQTGLQQKASVSTNFRMAKYLNVSPAINYDETWLLKKYKLTFDPDSVIYKDTITFDTLRFKAPTESFVNDFGAFRNFNASLSVNTQIFGTKKWSKGWLRGVRHTMKPSLSFIYKPGNKENYEAMVDTDTRPDFNLQKIYSIYSNSPFGTLTGTEEQMGISYNITNIFEAKYWSKKDTIEKNTKLFNNINVNGSYNFVADSLKWSNVNITGNTVVLKGLTNFYFLATLSPYVYNNGRITAQQRWDDKKFPLGFRNFSGQFSTSVSFRKIVEIFKGPKKDQNTKATDNQPRTSREPGLQTTESEIEEKDNTVREISLADWFENFNFSHALNFEVRKVNERDTFVVSSHTLNVSGSIPLTKNWNINVGNIAYDIKNKSFVYPYLSFARDLHCWQMNFTWAPSNGVYSFFIGVKSTALSFLKYDYGQRNPSTLFTGRRR